MSTERAPAVLPDFIIVGAQKAATTSLHYILSQHSGLALSKVKEPGFFAYARHPHLAGQIRGSGQQGLAQWASMTDAGAYAQMWAHAKPGQLLGEASTHYLYRHADSIANMRRHYGPGRSPKIIAIVREPVRRAYSAWLMARRSGKEDRPFVEAVRASSPFDAAGHYRPDLDYVGFGRYAEALAAFKAAFPDCKVLLYEDLQADMDAAILVLQQFLGLRPENLPSAFVVNRSTRTNGQGLLSQILYADWPIKPWLRRCLSDRQALRLRQWLEGQMPGPPQLGLAERRALLPLFEADIRALHALLGDVRILNWLKA